MYTIKCYKFGRWITTITSIPKYYKIFRKNWKTNHFNRGEYCSGKIKNDPKTGKMGQDFHSSWTIRRMAQHEQQELFGAYVPSTNKMGFCFPEFCHAYNDQKSSTYSKNKNNGTGTRKFKKCVFKSASNTRDHRIHSCQNSWSTLWLYLIYQSMLISSYTNVLSLRSH